MLSNGEKIKKYFLIIVSLIVIVGIVMVYSSSYIYSKENFGASTYFFFKQLLFVLIGSLAAVVVAKTKFSFWFKNIYLFNGIVILLLLLTMTPLGVSVKGSHRWIEFLNYKFQPGEFIKYTLGLSAVYYFSKFYEYELRAKLLNALHFIFPLILLLIQPDFGTFSISAILIAFACFMSDFPRKYFYAAFISGGISAAVLLVAAPYRVKRLLTFMDPWSDPQNSGFQIIQSYLAFANGHIFGQGIGNSNEKLFYLPEAHNDFILSVIGEELGFVGVLFIVLLFLLFTFLGFKLALSPRSNINKQVISIFIFAIAIQSFLNMGVVLGLLPTKGLNLPFISYGGSSMLANLVAIGFVLSALKAKSQIEENIESPRFFSQTAIGR